jgi:hypothetical protein
MTNPTLRDRRRRKAEAIAALVKRFEISEEMLRRASSEQWTTIAFCAGFKKQPSPPTRKLIYRALRTESAS